MQQPAPQQCFFKQNNIKYVDYKDIELLKKFLTPSAKIMARRRTCVSAKNQRKLSLAIKQARFMGLLPYIQS